ncbi:hypothetical protein [Nonomuraea dietziae]
MIRLLGWLLSLHRHQWQPDPLEPPIGSIRFECCSRCFKTRTRP